MHCLTIFFLGLAAAVSGAALQQPDCGYATTLHGDTQCLEKDLVTEVLNDGMKAMYVNEGCICYFCTSKDCQDAHEVVGPSEDMSFVKWIPDGYSYFCKSSLGCPPILAES